MSGRYEKEKQLEERIQSRLDGAPSILTEYYYHLVGSGKSYDTTYRYINYVLSFIDYTFKNGCDEQFYKKVRTSHINKYITSLRTKNVDGKIERTSDSLRTVQWSGLNSFFQFLVPDYIDENPVNKTDRPKMKDNPKVTYLTKEEISNVLDNAAKMAPESLKNRDLCVLKLGFSTGLRVSAIVQIDIDDIDFKRNQIRITEKGDYDDYVFFGDNLKEQLQLWLQDRKKYFGDADTNALFVSMKRNRMSDDMVANMLQKYTKGITDKKVTPHVMRHSCATNLYEQTGDIYLCSRQLRHKNVTTTQRYAELSKEKQREASNILDSLI